MFDQVRLSEYRPGTRTSKLRGGAGKTGGGEGLVIYSNEGLCLFPKEDDNGIDKVH